jgi:hypothetical protein
MSFTKMTADVENITPLKDRPNEKPNGLSATELRKKFDQAAIALKDFINRHIDELGANTAAGNIGAKITVNGQRLNVNLQQAIDTAVEIGSSSGIQDGSVTNAKLRSAVDGANGAVSTDKINDGAVTAAKLGSNSVTAAKIEGGAVSAEYTETLDAEDWSGDAAPYTQAVAVQGVTASDSPIIDLVASDTYSTAVNEDEAWGKIYKAVAGSGTITFYAKEIPSVALTFKARCIRK